MLFVYRYLAVGTSVVVDERSDPVGGNVGTLGRADNRPLSGFVWTTFSRGPLRGPYLGEMRSVRGRPSTEMVGIGLSVSNFAEIVSSFRFSRACGCPGPRGCLKMARAGREAQCDKKNGHLPLGFEPRL